MILDNANLVCGTVSGFLKHPDVQEEKNSPRAIFDILIIDEASKTTFQEFVVPALYCKKWILVGDILQLSPFVDDLIVRRTLEGIIPDSDQQICRDVFCCWKYPSFNLIISEPEDKILELYKKQINAFNLEYLDLDSESEISPNTFLANQIFIGHPENINKCENSLPHDAFLRGSTFSIKLVYAHQYWEKFLEQQTYSSRYQGNWGEILAWRLIRRFTLRVSEGDKKNIELKEDIDHLLPAWYDEERLRKTNDDIEMIQRIAFPSILELIQHGFVYYERSEPWKHTVIRNGFNEADFSARHIILTYQHRMHPEISEFPRQEIYKGRALQDNPQLDRNWAYPKYNKRCMWVHVQNKINPTYNVNKLEAKQVLAELEHFLKFGKNNKRKDGKHWEIAVLTFYSLQEDLLRNLLTTTFNLKVGSQEYILPKFNCNVKICTVDRFQGQEADLVLLSFVKTNSVGFLNSINRLNVGITRARYQLVMIGNKQFFLKQEDSPILQKLAQISGDIALT